MAFPGNTLFDYPTSAPLLCWCLDTLKGATLVLRSHWLVHPATPVSGVATRQPGGCRRTRPPRC